MGWPFDFHGELKTRMTFRDKYHLHDVPTAGLCTIFASLSNNPGLHPHMTVQARNELKGMLPTDLDPILEARQWTLALDWQTYLYIFFE